MNFKSLVLGGCGPRCIAFMGCLFQLSHNQIISLDDIDTYVGVSSGSMLCYLMIIGYTPHDILQHMIRDKIFKMLHMTANMSNMFSGGIFDYNIINNYLQKLTFEKTGKNFITMKDIRELYNKRFVTCSFNETLDKTEYFDSSNPKYDHVSCLVAIRASSNIPYVFDEFIFNECSYIDGGFSDILPIHIADNKLHNVLAMSSNNTQAPKLMSTIQNIKIFSKFFSRLQIPVNILMKRRLEYASPKIKLINIPMDDFPIYDFDLDTTIIMDLFNTGMTYANDAPEFWEASHVKKD